MEEIAPANAFENGTIAALQRLMVTNQWLVQTGGWNGLRKRYETLQE
jgi:hypothetical protein